MKEYNWYSFNKQQGVFQNIQYSSVFLLNLELYYLKFLLIFVKSWIDFVNELVTYLYVVDLPEKSKIATYRSSLNRLFYSLMPFRKLGPADITKDLLVDKYFYYGYRNRSVNAYVYSSFESEEKDILTVYSFRENLLLEYIWAIFPSLVIFLILIPSLYLLYSLEEDMSPRFNIKVIGHQWFWSYEFDNYDLSVSYEFESNLVQENDLVEGAKRLLEVDNRLYLPVNIPLRFLITSSDVLHSWAVPELGIKVDAVPGRLNDSITLIRRPGVFYGQCSELCGVGHGFMPIAVEAVTYKHWLTLMEQYKVDQEEIAK